MLFLREFCETSTVLKIIMFIRELVKIIFIIVPICLIVMVTIDCTKNVINGNYEYIKKNLNLSIKRLMMAILVFYVPVIINFVNELVKDYATVAPEYTICLDNANSSNIKIFEEEEKAEKLAAELERKKQNISDISTDNPYISGNSIYVNPLPDDEKYYPIMGKDMDGNMTEFLEYDGKYLTDSEMQYLENYIQESVNKVGNNWGIRVAAAGYSLVFGLNQYGLRLHYEKAGTGYTTASEVIGGKVDCDGKHFCVNWGLHITAEKILEMKYHPKYPYENEYSGVDCTGFVKWSIGVGCGYVGWMWNTDNYQDGHSSQRGDFKNAKPGDYMLRPGHVVLVVKNNGDGSVIVAESTSGYNKIGTMFNKYDASSGSSYRVIYMDDFYDEYCKIEN